MTVFITLTTPQGAGVTIRADQVGEIVDGPSDFPDRQETIVRTPAGSQYVVTEPRALIAAMVDGVLTQA